MKSLTWTRESHGLFDYESKSIKKKDLKATTSGVLVRRGDSVDFLTGPQAGSDDEQETTLFNLNQSVSNKVRKPNSPNRKTSISRRINRIIPTIDSGS